MAHPANSPSCSPKRATPMARLRQAAVACAGRIPRLFQAGLALAGLAISIAFVAGVSHSLILKTTAYLVLAVSLLCLLAASLVEYVKPMLEERRDPDGVPAQVPVILADLASKAGIAIPRTTVVRNRAPNARVSLFTRRSMVINRGLLEALSPLAFNGTMGHEIGHIVSGHLRAPQRILPLSWIGLVLGTCVLYVTWKAGTVSIAWPVCAAVAMAGVWLVVARVSRRQEFEADRAGAEVTGVDAQLAALNEVEQYRRARGNRPRLEKAGRLVATHPTYAERKAALHSIARGNEE